MDNSNDIDVAFINKVKDEFELRIGHRIDSTKRDYANVERRASLSNAVRPYSTLKKIGEMFDRDHASIVHYIKEHDSYVRFYPSYVKLFSEATQIVNDLSRDMGIVPRTARFSKIDLNEQIAVIEKTVVELRKMHQNIEKQISKEVGYARYTS